MMETVPGYLLDEPGTVQKISAAMEDFGLRTTKRRAARMQARQPQPS